MLKSIAVAIVLIGLIAAGISYTILNAPELPEHQLFDASVRLFAENASQLERQLNQKGQLKNETKNLILDFSDRDKINSSIQIKMTVSNNQVTFGFGDGNTELANQTIIFEPFKLDESDPNAGIGWKCIGGSVLIRFRSKDCRLGYGIITSQLLSRTSEL